MNEKARKVLEKLKENKKILLLLLAVFFIVFLTRIAFLGSSLWHDDAFSFVNRALTLSIKHDYTGSLTGHPLWVFVLALFLKIGHLFTGEWSVIVLPNLVSAFFGSLLVFPIYRLSKYAFLTQKHASYYSLITTFVILFNPVIWRWSTVAMGDVFAMFFALFGIVFFLDFLEKEKYKFLWLSNLFLYFALMTRLIYGLVLFIFVILLLYRAYAERRKIKTVFKEFIYIGSGWLILIVLMFLSYSFLNGFNLSFFEFFSHGKSVTPTITDLFSASWVILKSIGLILIPLLIIGFFYLYKTNPPFFVLCLSLFLVFSLYLSTWNQKGHFDIERYAILTIPFLYIALLYIIRINNATKTIAAIFLAFCFILLIKGLANPVDFYATYSSKENILKNYVLKSSQISQHTIVDGDMQRYRDLQDHIKDGDLVFHWGNDWSMPELLLAGAHLEKQAKLVSISSDEVLEEKISQYQGEKIYLLRGVFDSYEKISKNSDKYILMKNLILKNRSIIHYIPASD